MERDEVTKVSVGSSMAPDNKSLDRSGGSVFRIKAGAAKVALIRAARSTLTLRRTGNSKMFDLLKILIEKLMSLIQPSVFLELKRRNELAKVGATLFDIYFRLSDLVESGEQLVDSLELYVDRMTPDPKSSLKYTEAWGQRYLLPRLATQRDAIGRLTSAVASFSHQLRLIDPQTTRQLRFLLHLKLGSLFYLTRSLDAGKMPLERPTYEEVHTELERVSQSPDESEPRLYDDAGTHFASRLRPVIEAGSLDATHLWDLRAFETIQSYLETHEPRHTLQLLDDTCELLRGALLEHFSLHDVLLSESRSKRRREH